MTFVNDCSYSATGSPASPIPSKPGVAFEGAAPCGAEVPANGPQAAAPSGSPSATPHAQRGSREMCDDGTRLSGTLAGLRIEERDGADEGSEVQWPQWGSPEGPDGPFRVQVNTFPLLYRNPCRYSRAGTPRGRGGRLGPPMSSENCAPSAFRACFCVRACVLVFCVSVRLRVSVCVCVRVRVVA